MPIFKCFLKIAWKNKTPIIIYTIIFALLAIMFTSTASSDAESLYKDESIPIAIIDRDKSELSAALTDYLGRIHEIVDLPDDTQKLQDALFYRNIGYILFIHEGFELENVKLPKSTWGIYIDNQIDSYILTLQAYLNAGYNISEAVVRALRDANLSTNVTMFSVASDNTDMSAYYFQYLAYILMAIIISAIGPILMAFNKTDLAKRIESSSLTLRERNIQIALGCIVSSFALWIAFIAVAAVLYGNELLSAVGGLRVLNNFVYLAVCICIAFLLGQIMKSLNSLTAVNNAVTLGMSFICGIFVPQELLGSGVLSIAQFLPAYWYIRSSDMLFAITELSPADKRIYTEGILIQLGFAAAIFAVALLVSRQKKLASVI